jgi:uncharacterized protein YerC
VLILRELRCASENNLRFFAQICTDYQLMYLCQRKQVAMANKQNNKDYEIQISYSSVEGILGQQRPGLCEGRRKDEAADG